MCIVMEHQKSEPLRKNKNLGAREKKDVFVTNDNSIFLLVLYCRAFHILSVTAHSSLPGNDCDCLCFTLINDSNGDLIPMVVQRF